MRYQVGLRFVVACTLGVLSACSTMQGARSNGQWSYEVANGIEKSSREYLLVFQADSKDELRFDVQSRCSKPAHTEGAYGQCIHNIHVDPTNKVFTLNTGEDVVLVQFTWGSLAILGTIEYGCCAGPDTVTFYTDKGRYVGQLYGANLSKRGIGNNLITKRYDMENGTRYDNDIYFLVNAETAEDEYKVVVFHKGYEVRRIPVQIAIAEKHRCEQWYLNKFIAYGDRKDITLEIEGYFCDSPEGVIGKTYSCSVNEASLECEALR